MTQEIEDHPAGIGDLTTRVRQLEQRIETIERHYIAAAKVQAAVPPAGLQPEHAENQYQDEVFVDKGLIESNIFEYGLAWFGSLVLLFGIAFLSSLARNYMNSALASFVGYGAVAGVFFLGWHLRSSFTHLSFMLNLIAHLLVYYLTLRLFFFTDQPVIPAKGIVLVLMVAAIAVQCFFALRKRSELLATVAMVLALVTAIVGDLDVVTLPLIIVTAGLAVLMLMRYGWWRLLFTILILVYITQCIWLFNNPFMGNPVGTSDTHPYNLASLFIYGTMFSFIPMINPRDKFPSGIYPAAILINGICFSIMLLFVIAAFYLNDYVWIFTLISLLCLFYSIFLRYHIDRTFDPAFFAIYSFMSLSVAVYGYSKLPDAIWLLSLQSLLVVSWALWFRSRIIVVMNAILFIGILIIYTAFYPSSDRVNFALVITAFVSARVINWKKERLTLKTDVIRNTYLIALFFTMLFSLYHAVPRQYVTLSWTCASILYFIISLVLKNIKYRWMAIATVLCTGFYLFFIDFSNLETGYRVLAFLFLALISLGASVYFTKRVRKKVLE